MNISLGEREVERVAKCGYSSSGDDAMEAEKAAPYWSSGERAGVHDNPRAPEWGIAPMVFPRKTPADPILSRGKIIAHVKKDGGYALAGNGLVAWK